MNFYKDLGLENDATAAEIKAAHRKKAKITHPDGGGDRQEFEKVQKAYSNLKDPKKRKYYDDHGKEQDEPVPDMALSMIAQMFDSMLTQDLPSNFDYLSGLKVTVNNTIAEAMGRKIMFERSIKRFEKIAKKFHRKQDKGSNFFTIALEIKIRDLRDKIPRADEVVANSFKALQILNEYEFEKTDEPGVALEELLKGDRQ